MLAKLERRAAASISRGDRMRFLRAYAGGDARAWWRDVERAARALARRDLRHWERTATRAGRRFAAAEHAGWRGFARRDADLARLSAAAERARDPVPADSTLWCVDWQDLGDGEARRAWALAHALHDGRALAPRPLALLRRGTHTVLCSERSPGAHLAAAGEDLPAVRVLRRRLAALGRLPGPWPPGAVAIERRPSGGTQALLLDPRLLRLG
jgi:hypothetical protein